MNKSGINNQPLVSICMITYNHEKFISYALNSVLMQKVDFEYEIIIGEDCSTDDTRRIILEYYKKYPCKIKLILQKKNVGPVKNEYEVLSKCSGKYIAFLEGDDYWTDEYKLQKQIDFLETNSDYGMVYCDICVVDEYNNKLPVNVQNKFRVDTFEGNIFSTLLKKGNFIYYSTCLSRGDIIRDCMKTEKYEYVQDIYLWLVISSRLKVKYFNNVTTAYRRHAGNISSDPFTIVGRKTWEYSIVKGIKYAFGNKNIKLKKEDYNYILKLLILKIIKSKYIYLKYLSARLIIHIIFNYKKLQL